MTDTKKHCGAANTLIGALIGIGRAVETGAEPTAVTRNLILQGLNSIASVPASVFTPHPDFSDSASPESTYTQTSGVSSSAAQNDARFSELTARIRTHKAELIPNCISCASPCGRTFDYDKDLFETAAEDVRSMKALILSGLFRMASDAWNAMLAGAFQADSHDNITRFFCQALFVLGENWTVDELLPFALKTGHYIRICAGLTH